MSFDWSEYLHLAEELVGQTSTGPAGLESRQRAAISRAYYAALISVRNFSETRDGVSFGRHKVHDELANTWMASRNDIRKQIGSTLDRMRLDRNKADYENTLKNAGRTAEQALLQCRNILDGLKKL